jgi:hypothetical protein
MRSTLVWAACSLLLAGFAPEALAAGFEATAQLRSVAVTITQTTVSCITPQSCSTIGTSNQSDAQTAPDFSPFVATAQVAPFTGARADQDSSIDVTKLVASGASQSFGSGGLTTPPNIFTITSSDSASRFSTSFDVDIATPFRLTGSVTAAGGLTAGALSRIRLRTAGGTPIAEMSAETDPECQSEECSTVGPLPLHATGVLAPGSYVLEAEASSQASPFTFAGNFFTMLSSSQYQVELSATAVPALGDAGLALLALSLGFAARLARFPARLG